MKRYTAVVTAIFEVEVDAGDQFSVPAVAWLASQRTMPTEVKVEQVRRVDTPTEGAER